MLADRKIIFKAVVGSKLYGTDLSQSDDDFLGVFLPNREDLLGMATPPSEITDNVKMSVTEKNTKGDVDCKYLSLKHFFKMLLEGQSGATELLFVPEAKVLDYTWEWELIQKSRDTFLSRRGVAPMIGFAASQSHKSSIKGANLNLIRKLLENLAPYATGATKLEDVIDIYGENYALLKGGVEIRHWKAEDGTPVLEIAGRMFNFGATVKNFLIGLKKMEEKYGQRSETAAVLGVDTKSLSHAYRLISEAEEYLLHGTITFPRPDATFLKEIRSGRYQADFREEIAGKIRYLKEKVEPRSPLPKKPNYNKANRLHMDLAGQQL